VYNKLEANFMIVFKTISSFLKDENYRNLLYTSMVILLIGTLTYHFVEGWSFLDALYFSVVTLTTIGYGDFAPKTDFGKLFTIVYILLGIGIILGFINTVYSHYNNMNNSRKSDHKKE